MTFMKNYELVFNTIYAGSDRPSAATFAAWIDRAQRTRQALLENKRLHKADIESMTGIWADAKIAERRAVYEADEMELAKIARDRVTRDLENVIAEKQKAYDRATGAPTTEQVSLINILEMRARYEELQPSDFANVVGKLADNYHALKMLGNIANKCNVAFPQLRDTFREDCETARERASTLLAEIDTPTDQLGYLSRLFWDAGSVGIEQNVLNRLDSLSYLTTTAEQVEQAAMQPKVDAAKGTQKEGKESGSDICSKVRLKGLESISSLADQFHVWWNFKDQREAADMLADFALCSREAAAIMIDDFRNGFIDSPRDRSLQPETDHILKGVNRSGTTDTSAKSRSDSRRTRRAEECNKRSNQKRQDPRY